MPWSADTKFFQWPKKEGPYRIALVNGFVGNTWRIQMIQTAKAYAEQPEVAPIIKEFKVVSTGTDVAAQLGAIEDFINRASTRSSPSRSTRRLRPRHPPRQRSGVVLVPFDNVLDTDEVMQVNEDQYEMGQMMGRVAAQEHPGRQRQDPRGARPARQLGRPRPP